MIPVSPPLFSVIPLGGLFLLGVSKSCHIIYCGPQDPLSPPETFSVPSPGRWPWWISSAVSRLDAVSVILAKEAEDMRDRSRLLGLNFLPVHHPGLRGAWTAPYPRELEGLQSCRPHPLAAGPRTVSFLVPSSPAMLAVWAQPSPLGCRLDSPATQTTVPPPLPQRDMTFFLDCLY